MKKNWLLIALLGIAVLALGIAGTAYAQDPSPGTPDGPYPYVPGMGGYGMGGYGMMGGYGVMGDYGMMGGYGMMGYGAYGEEGPMYDAMIASLAEALGLPADELEARHDAGETLWEIAEAEGLSTDEIQELMFSAHDETLEEAVAAGWLTQEQAEWMDERMDLMWDGEYNHCGAGGIYAPGNSWRGMNGNW